MNDLMKSVLVFREIEFEPVEIDGIYWLRGAQVALALGYQNPANAIKDLFARNEDEFDETTTQVVQLPTAGGIQPVRIFSPRGCHLLGMFARTEVAKEFRRWVLDVLEGHAAPVVGRKMSITQHLALLKYRGQLVRELARETELGTATELYGNFRRISRMLGMQPGAIESLAPGLKQLPLPATTG